MFGVVDFGDWYVVDFVELCVGGVGIVLVGDFDFV